jgi:DNA-binding NtrC family response regulator
MRLNAMVVADPVRSAAELIAQQCRRLAAVHIITTSAHETIEAVSRDRPQMVIVSLELPDEKPESLVKKLIKSHPDVLLVATFRELSVQRMDKLARAGVDELIAQPVDATDIFRAASKRFNIPFRRHERFSVTLDVQRADGVVIGRTLNISEGGLAMEAHHPMAEGTSVLVDLPLPAITPVRVRFQVLSVQGQPPTRTIVRGQFENLRGEEHRRLAGYLATLDNDNPILEARLGPTPEAAP